MNFFRGSSSSSAPPPPSSSPTTSSTTNKNNNNNPNNASSPSSARGNATAGGGGQRQQPATPPPSPPGHFSRLISGFRALYATSRATFDPKPKPKPKPRTPKGRQQPAGARLQHGRSTDEPDTLASSFSRLSVSDALASLSLNTRGGTGTGTGTGVGSSNEVHQQQQQQQQQVAEPQPSLGQMDMRSDQTMFVDCDDGSGLHTLGSELANVRIDDDEQVTMHQAVVDQASEEQQQDPGNRNTQTVDEGQQQHAVENVPILLPYYGSAGELAGSRPRQGMPVQQAQTAASEARGKSPIISITQTADHTFVQVRPHTEATPVFSPQPQATDTAIVEESMAVNENEEKSRSTTYRQASATATVATRENEAVNDNSTIILQDGGQSKQKAVKNENENANVDGSTKGAQRSLVATREQIELDTGSSNSSGEHSARDGKGSSGGDIARSHIKTTETKPIRVTGVTAAVNSESVPPAQSPALSATAPIDATNTDTQEAEPTAISSPPSMGQIITDDDDIMPTDMDTEPDSDGDGITNTNKRVPSPTQADSEMRVDQDAVVRKALRRASRMVTSDGNGPDDSSSDALMNFNVPAVTPPSSSSDPPPSSSPSSSFTGTQKKTQPISQQQQQQAGPVFDRVVRRGLSFTNPSSSDGVITIPRAVRGGLVARGSSTRGGANIEAVPEPAHGSGLVAESAAAGTGGGSSGNLGGLTGGGSSGNLGGLTGGGLRGFTSQQSSSSSTTPRGRHHHHSHYSRSSRGGRGSGGRGRFHHHHHRYNTNSHHHPHNTYNNYHHNNRSSSNLSNNNNHHHNHHTSQYSRERETDALNYVRIAWAEAMNAYHALKHNPEMRHTCQPSGSSRLRLALHRAAERMTACSESFGDGDARRVVIWVDAEEVHGILVPLDEFRGRLGGVLDEIFGSSLPGGRFHTRFLEFDGMSQQPPMFNSNNNNNTGLIQQVPPPPNPAFPPRRQEVFPSTVAKGPPGHGPGAASLQSQSQSLSSTQGQAQQGLRGQGLKRSVKYTASQKQGQSQLKKQQKPLQLEQKQHTKSLLAQTASMMTAPVITVGSSLGHGQKRSSQSVGNAIKRVHFDPALDIVQSITEIAVNEGGGGGIGVGEGNDGEVVGNTSIEALNNSPMGGGVSVACAAPTGGGVGILKRFKPNPAAAKRWIGSVSSRPSRVVICPTVTTSNTTINSNVITGDTDAGGGVIATSDPLQTDCNNDNKICKSHAAQKGNNKKDDDDDDEDDDDDDDDDSVAGMNVAQERLLQPAGAAGERFLRETQHQQDEEDGRGDAQQGESSMSSEVALAARDIVVTKSGNDGVGQEEENNNEVKKDNNNNKGGKKKGRPAVESRPIEPDNKGYEMLERLGWHEGQGLGSDASGLQEPLLPQKVRPGRRGLGGR